MWCLCGEESTYTGRNKFTPLEALVGRGHGTRGQAAGSSFRERKRGKRRWEPSLDGTSRAYRATETKPLAPEKELSLRVKPVVRLGSVTAPA